MFASKNLPIGRRTVLKGIGGVAATPFLVSSPLAAQDAKVINFGIQNNFPGALGIVWAREKLYEPFGLKVKLAYLPDGRTVRDTMIAGQTDVGTMQLTPFLVGATTGRFVALAKVYVGDSAGMLVKKDSNIRKVEDLRGKKVSITLGSSTGRAWTDKVAPSFGLKKGDYTIVNLAVPDQVSALATGQVDATCGPEPYLTMAEVENIGRVLVRFGKWEPSPNVLTVSRTFLDQRPDDVVKLMQSWLKVLDVWNNEPDKAAKSLVQTFQQAGYNKITTAMIRSMMKNFRVEPEISPEFIAYIKKEAQAMVAAGKLKSEPDFARAVAPEMLEKARKA